MLDTAHRYFLEVMRTGSVKGAAANLHVVPSAVSRQLSKLEDELGTPLFERRPHGMVPTSAAELLCNYVQRMAMDAQRVRYELRNFQRSESSTIRIGVHETVARNLLSGVLAAYQQAHPDIRFDVQIASSMQIAQRLGDGTIDLGLSYSLAQRPSVKVHFEVPAPVRAIMAPGHALAGARRIQIEALRAYPIALIDSSATVRLLFDACSQSDTGAPFNIVLTSTSSSLIYEVVKAGHVITLGGEVAMQKELRSGALVSVPLAEAGFSARKLQIQTATEYAALPAVLKSFMDALAAGLAA